MNSHRWHTRQDVVNDLAEVTGIAVNDIDDHFILRGDKPPPRPHHLSDEDAEIQLRFGCLAEQGDHEDEAPDLAGITQMLRMVNNYDTPEIENIQTKEFVGEDLSKQTITISKLDPCVKEFVPKSIKSVEVGKRKVDSNALNNLKKEIVKACADKVVETETTDIKDDERSGDKNNDEEKLRMAEILKSKIIQGSKAKTLRHKTERNVAIAALIKLNSTPPHSNTPKVPSVVNSPKKIPKAESSNESSGSSTKPIILFPPEYFEVPTCSSKGNIEIPEINPEPEMDRQIKESIDKVNNWLNKPEVTKPKAPTIYLEPVTFKRKEASSSSSPSSFQMNNPISSSSPKTFVKLQPVSATPSFVPSSYATDLAKKYEERSKAKEALDLDIWTKLEKDLKAKDEQIKRNKEQQSIDENQNDTLDSSRTTFE